ncbi:MAG: hypothetical protein EXS05_06675 [Planctomycetaceae bacterium]|nr:hypothetical protein [Planctomycetaceae bacterium]
MIDQVMLVRFGVIPEVGRFACALSEPPERGAAVIVNTHRGPELGTLLQATRSGTNGVAMPSSEPSPPPNLESVVRVATSDDVAQHGSLRREAEADYAQWQRRINEWGLELELIDLEWTLDRQKLILYVLGGRGPDTTKLALQAAALGQAVIEVQPVSAEGVVPLSTSGGGCGSGGCGSGGCHE